MSCPTCRCWEAVRRTGLERPPAPPPPSVRESTICCAWTQDMPRRPREHGAIARASTAGPHVPMQPPTRPPGQASPRARSPRHDSDTDASPTRRVRARTTQAGSSLAGRLPARQGAAAPSVEAGPSSRQPRTAVPPPRAPAPTQPSGSAGASTSTGAGGAPQATPARTDAAPQAAESLRQELAALGIQGPPSRAQFVPLVMAAVARPDLEPRIHQAAAALLAHQEGTGHDVGEALRSLWLFLQLGSPAAARVIERILVPGGAPEAGRAPSSDSEATGSDEDDRASKETWRTWAHRWAASSRPGWAMRPAPPRWISMPSMRKKPPRLSPGCSNACTRKLCPNSLPPHGARWKPR